MEMAAHLDILIICITLIADNIPLLYVLAEANRKRPCKMTVDYLDTKILIRKHDSTAKVSKACCSGSSNAVKNCRNRSSVIFHKIICSVVASAVIIIVIAVHRIISPTHNSTE